MKAKGTVGPPPTCSSIFLPFSKIGHASSNLIEWDRFVLRPFMWGQTRLLPFQAFPQSCQSKPDFIHFKPVLSDQNRLLPFQDIPVRPKPTSPLQDISVSPKSSSFSLSHSSKAKTNFLHSNPFQSGQNRLPGYKPFQLVQNRPPPVQSKPFQ
jgi:hypothetical protein